MRSEFYAVVCFLLVFNEVFPLGKTLKRKGGLVLYHRDSKCESGSPLTGGPK